MPLKVEDLLDRLHGVRRSGTGWIALCPVHEDHSPSLAIRAGRTRPAVALCRACGARYREVLKAVGLTDGEAPPEHAAYIRPARDEREAAFRDVLADGTREPWARNLLRYAASDLYRALGEMVTGLHYTANRLPPELEATWTMLSTAVELEDLQRALGVALDGLDASA